MSASSHDNLPPIDPVELTGIVRAALGSPALELGDWSVAPLSHEKIISTTGGLFLLTGTAHGATGERPWSVVLKLLANPREWGQEPQGWSYWKRELLAYQSGLLATLPKPLVAPRCYGFSEDSSQGRIWMEHITETRGGRWGPEEFRQAAHHAGRFAATYLGGEAVPQEPWLSAPFFRTIFADDGFWAPYMDPANPQGAWQSPLVQQAFDTPTRAGVLRIWAEKRHFWEVLDRLPQVLCHSDFHRRNLMWRAGIAGQDELVAVDWSFCGPGALGMDIGELIANSAFFCELEPAAVDETEAAALQGYLAGLKDAGWGGDERLARLGYLLSATLWMGATLPGWAALMLAPEAGVNVQALYGRPADAVLEGWVMLTQFLLGRAEEARSLIAELGLS